MAQNARVCAENEREADAAASEMAKLLGEALNNMPHGVVMFDANSRLVVSNRRYIEMYGLSEAVVRQGCTLQALIEHRRDVGHLIGDVEQYRIGILDTVRQGNVSGQFIETADGRAIHVVNQPIPSGGWVVTHEDVTRYKAAEARIEHLAHHDALTDLPNRTLFQAQLEQALHMVAAGGKLALLFIDLDNFKSVNDTLGHPVGDQLLNVVASRLRSCVGSHDTIARLGGDEFVVIQNSIAAPSDAARLAAHIRDTISAPYTLFDHPIVIDVSIGIALAPHDGMSTDALLKSADMALYGAKSAGRGVYRFFERAMDIRMMERRNLEIDLRKALENRELELHYQPILDLKNDRINGCEALLRWRHPNRGVLAPDSFMDVAEETGLIAPIGQWVLHTACAEAACWPNQMTVAVNVSPSQFSRQDLAMVVMQALDTSGLPAARLEIEITEAILLEHTLETLAVLHQLRALGVRIAMDDFGTGYSSLSYLQKFPFDKIKIDRSFTTGVSDHEGSTAIIRAIIGIADTFRMVTTIEGVETEQQKAIATALGCAEMQGYLLSEPRPPREIRDFLYARQSGAPGSRVPGIDCDVDSGRESVA